MTKIMTNRLANTLYRHNVLKGNNYAGLPGGSCHTPIHILESVISDAKSHNKPLFIFLQDISKAFDSIDTHMLRLALNRLKIPTTFIELVLNLFTNRSNRVITANGLSSPYKVQIGIDQGEVISPLLWVIYIDPPLVALNQCNSTPYQLQASTTTSTSNAVSTLNAELSTLAFMDDTTLVSSSIIGLIQMLNVANEFYHMNNTKINFLKADLITNRDPSSPEEPLSSTPTPYTFNLITDSFTITPIAPKDSFRFLGVWFTLAISSAFVKAQCRTEYRLFANKLRGKQLTVKQLVYLNNAVLIPKIEYRMMCSLFSETECNSISSPMRVLVKRANRFSISLPSSFLHYEQGIGLTNLYQRIVQNHIATFTTRFNSSSLLSTIYNIRLFLLRDDLWFPSSPFEIKNFDVWKYTNTFKTDLIFRTIYFASLLDISFDHTNLLSSNSITISNPIHEYFQDNPGLFAKALYQIKKHNIRSFSQCVTDDGCALLPHAIIMAKHSTATNSIRVPAWYKYLKAITTTSLTSYALKEEFIISNPEKIIESTLSIPDINIASNPIWITTWNESQNSANFGRVIHTNNNNSANVTHWIISSDVPTSAILTPKSISMTLRICSGCQLNDLSIQHRKRHKQGPFPCAFTVLLNEVHHLIDGPGKSSKGMAHFKKPARFYEAQARRLFWSLHNQVGPISPNISPTPIVPHNQGLLKDIYISEPAVVALLPLARRLRNDPHSQNWIFFTDGAYSRTLDPTTPYNNGSGFLAAHNDTHSVQGFEMSFTSTSWPSSYKAEVMAFFVLISILPEDFTCTIKVDCQALLNTFYEVLYNTTPSKTYRRPMFQLWTLIYAWINTKRLCITVQKVKGHSTNIINERADFLAKKGLVSPSFIITPNDIHQHLQCFPTFSNSKITIERDPRKFVSELQQAQFFEQFISLSRFNNNLIFQHNANLLNWECTWFCLHHDLQTVKYDTSFQANKAFTLSTKLFLNELPLLAELQRRKPDIYDPTWNCIACDMEKETWSHLWTCPHTAPKLMVLRDTVKTMTLQTLAEHEKAPIRGLSQRFSAKFNDLSCWLLPQDTNSSCINFDQFLRGFIPKELSTTIKSVVGTQELTQTFLATIITITHEIFKEHIWKPRCEAMIAFEKNNNITTKQKRSSTSLPSSNSLSRNLPSLLNRWQTWISRAMDTGFSWQDFHTCINSLACWFLF